VNLTRYDGVFAPSSVHRALVTKAGRGKGREGKGLQGPMRKRRASAACAGLKHFG